MTSWRRPARVVAGVEELMPRLQTRDVEIITVLGRHKVLTLVQIARLFFSSVSSARDRVNTLYELGVLRRFRPASTRAAYRYALSHLGTCLYLAEQGEERPMPSKRKHEDGFVRLMNSRKLAHTEAVNDFFTRLYVGLRASYGSSAVAVEWEPETTIFGNWGREVRPDGGAAVTINGAEAMNFWFEHDTGTEPQHVLTTKVERYRNPHPAAKAHQIRTVLFQLPGQARQSHFHQANADTSSSITIATTVTDPDADPTDRVWWQLGAPHGELLRLDQLPPSRIPRTGPTVLYIGDLIPCEAEVPEKARRRSDLTECRSPGAWITSPLQGIPVVVVPANTSESAPALAPASDLASAIGRLRRSRPHKPELIRTPTKPI